jgi:threonine dehydratase
VGWLGAPPGAAWPSDEEEVGNDANPFLRYRQLLWAHHRAEQAGIADTGFVELVRRLDDAVGELDGRGFECTPLVMVDKLAEMIGQTGGVWAKDETGNVSGSHKARHLFGLALHLEVEEVPLDTPLAIASCGNAALAAALVARAAGRPLVVHVPTWADSWILGQLEELGANVEVCERRNGESGDPCMLRFREAVVDGAVAFGCQGTESPWTIDGGRTLGFELADQLSAQKVLVDRILIQVGGGALASSTIQALTDATKFGVLERRPVLNAVQAEGCAPLARAFNLLVDTGDAGEALAGAASNAEAFMWPWDDPHSEATGILDDVTYDWRPIVWDMACGDTPGGPIVAAEEHVLAAHQLVRDYTEVSADATGTAGLAGLLSSRRDGCVDPTDRVALLLTGRSRLVDV